MSVAYLYAAWQSQLTGSAKLLLMALADACNDEGFCILTLEELERKSALSRSYVCRLLNKFADLGLIERLRRTNTNGSNAPTVYHLLIVDSDQMSPSPSVPTSLPSVPTSPQGDLSTLPTVPGISKQGNQDATVASSKRSANGRPKRSAARSKARDARLDHPAIQAYRKAAHLHVPATWRDRVIAAVGYNTADVQRWYALVDEWVGRGWKPNNIVGMLDAFARPIPAPLGNRRPAVQILDDYYAEQVEGKPQ